MMRMKELSKSIFFFWVCRLESKSLFNYQKNYLLDKMLEKRTLRRAVTQHITTLGPTRRLILWTLFRKPTRGGGIGSTPWRSNLEFNHHTRKKWRAFALASTPTCWWKWKERVRQVLGPGAQEMLRWLDEPRKDRSTHRRRVRGEGEIKNENANTTRRKKTPNPNHKPGPYPKNPWP